MIWEKNLSEKKSLVSGTSNTCLGHIWAETARGSLCGARPGLEGTRPQGAQSLSPQGREVVVKAQPGVRPATCRLELGLQLPGQRRDFAGRGDWGHPAACYTAFDVVFPKIGHLLKCRFLGSLPSLQCLHLSQALEEAGGCELGTRTSGSAADR